LDGLTGGDIITKRSPTFDIRRLAVERVSHVAKAFGMSSRDHGKLRTIVWLLQRSGGPRAKHDAMPIFYRSRQHIL
jgi:hypothetical protein